MKVSRIASLYVFIFVLCCGATVYILNVWCDKEIHILQQTCVTPEMLDFSDQLKKLMNGEHRTHGARRRPSVFSFDGIKWVDKKMPKYPPSNTTAVLNSPAGPIEMHVYDSIIDDTVSKSIMTKGVWEAMELKQMASLLQQNEECDFIDIGFHIGMFSLSAAKLGRQVVSVDCFLNNAHMLQSSLNLNLLSNVTIINNAISDSRKSVSLQTERRDPGRSFIQENEIYNPNNVEMCHSIIMDDIVGFVHSECIIMKIDIEGYEDKLVAGAKRLFKEFDIRYILMEWRFHKDTRTGRDIIHFMQLRNFEPRKTDLSPLQFSESIDWPNNIIWKKNTY